MTTSWDDSANGQPRTYNAASVTHLRPLSSLVASAKRLTSRTVASSRKVGGGASWQDDAWEMYDLVGEQRFLATTLANRMSQAKFYVGLLNDDPTEPPEPVEDAAISDVLGAIGDSPTAFAQMIQRLGVNLFVAGDGWLAGIPSRLMPLSLRNPASLAPEQPEDEYPVEDMGIAIEDLEWRMLSVNEVSATATGALTLHLGPTEAERVMCSPDEVFLIRVWKPHPRRWWEADSPTRSSLPILRELVGLTMHISAQVDSRLAGAGVLIVPQSAQRALNVAAGLPADDTSDQFTEALMEAMITPISDRASASALVPLIVTVPDEAVGLFNYLNFAKPLDTEARNLRDEAIRRLALGQDAPPELLLGTGGMNHWGAWLVREDVVTTHIEPPLALICDALTTQYLWPVLIDGGMDEETAHQYVVWYDVAHMIMRPNRSADALELHSRGALNSTALRDATGFGEQDALFPDDLEVSAAITLDLAARNPALIASPGLGAVEEQVRALISGQPVPEPPQPEVPQVVDEPVDDGEQPTGEVALPEENTEVPDEAQPQPGGEG